MKLPERQIGSLLRSARRRADIGLRAAADRAGTSHSALAAYEAGRKSPTAVTLMRILDAYGFTLAVEPAPRVRERDGLPRGEELEEVLALAEAFPARVEEDLDVPRFGKP